MARPRKRRRRRAPEDAREALVAALDSLGLSDQVRRIKIAAVWAEAVGHRVAKRSEPHAFNRGVLTVRVQTAAWQNELSYLKADLIAALNKALGTPWVKDIKLIAGAVRPRPNALRTLPPVTPAEQARAREVAEVITDPEVRLQFASLMEKQARARRTEPKGPRHR